MEEDQRFQKEYECPLDQLDEIKVKMERIGCVVVEQRRENATVFYKVALKPDHDLNRPAKQPKEHKGLLGMAQAMRGAGCIIILLLVLAAIGVLVYLFTR